MALIPTRQVCDVANPYEGAMWGKYYDTNTIEYGCYRNNGTKYTDEEICSLLVVDDTNQSTLTDNNIQQLLNDFNTANEAVIDANTAVTTANAAITAAATDALYCC